MSAQRSLRYWLVVAAVFVFSLGGDLATKVWAQNSLQKRPKKKIELIDGWFSLTYARNSAGAWGLMQSVDETIRHGVLIGVSLLSILVLALLTWSCPRDRLLAATALAAILGGAVGNLIDRCRWGYVIDFIDWHKGFRWPIFNIADVTITFGVVVLAVLVALERQPPDPTADSTEPTAPDTPAAGPDSESRGNA